ncbi:Transmembrane protein FAM155A [Microtus ochrogaster]|uniref:Transmembrane protein FAM155A n=1 Tax=Microtus ochrogaster TaxID=79684 RepID=A0A8J6FW10_MICOH|nr:Transmembrane protein FAM155A [Microtus ochrogaster]
MFAPDIPTPSDRKPKEPRFPQHVSAVFPFLELLESTLRGTRALDCSASLEGAAEVLAQRSPPGGPRRQAQYAGGGGGGGSSKGNRGKNNRSKALFLGNSAKPVWRLETCYPQGASSGQCFTVESADSVCARNWSRGAAAGEEQSSRGSGPTPLWNLSDFYLSFCNSYTLWELFSGRSSPSTLNCSLDVVLTEGGEMTTCRQCIEAYQDYDHHAQEKYEEFESVLHKYLQSDEYSVKSCPEDCKEEMKQMDGRIIAGVDGTEISLHIREKNLILSVLY